ncbi:hypothetical protein DTO013E5_6285 [Penicillium roqueforti]|nr:hypothetical protein CBS147337_8118 [Penicillium roqueforti]KAI2674097.1 hypothetical protein CBS147355_7272 [Penicillium roqueforti]KAI2714105.1 hypothetical protein CBS147318_6846 [Penicillium roqueforti]KAI2715811.1 hypothetical protein CBS147354_7194 [Penicillium roqueforti]KAI2739313.1 hypothetical protein DTO012A1_6141 [Penicillium roqueforti]
MLPCHQPNGGGSRAIREKRTALDEEIEKIDTSAHQLSGVLVTHKQNVRPTEKTKYLKNEKELSYLRGFLDNIKDFDPRFGSVWVASGLRTRQGANGHRINCDWGLVEVPDDGLSSNVTPGRHVLQGSPLPDKIDNLRLCLSGQRSGYSGGDYSLKEAHVKHEMIDGIKTSVPTVEHTVIASGTDFRLFARPGESGSLVYTKRDHVVVGLLFAGREETLTANFTHIEDLIADIKEITGAT